MPGPTKSTLGGRRAGEADRQRRSGRTRAGRAHELRLARTRHRESRLRQIVGLRVPIYLVVIVLDACALVGGDYRYAIAMSSALAVAGGAELALWVIGRRS